LKPDSDFFRYFGAAGGKKATAPTESTTGTAPAPKP
jgi:hypothetical protein